MKKQFFANLFILISIIMILESCSCNCGAGTENMVKGYITVVGNEPFTKLALQSDDDKTYILQCSKELEKELWQQQGSRYIIQYGSTQKEGDRTILIVEKVISITTENKTN